jgi:hypothetical protein
MRIGGPPAVVQRKDFHAAPVTADGGSVYVSAGDLENGGSLDPAFNAPDRI